LMEDLVRGDLWRFFRHNRREPYRLGVMQSIAPRLIGCNVLLTES